MDTFKTPRDNETRPADAGVQGAVSPDTGVAGAAPQDAAFTGAETGAGLENETDATADTAQRDDDPDYRPAHPGKTVFKPGELNNAGEDKEYFHPRKDHQFDAPKDANNHALTPDVEVAPGNAVKTIRSDKA